MYADRQFIPAATSHNKARKRLNVLIRAHITKKSKTTFFDMLGMEIIIIFVGDIRRKE